MAGIGHNGGPGTGSGFRAHCWTVARRELLGASLPVEVVRMQVKRAKALGLDYKTYAGVRATTGRDLIAFLYSSNALGVFRAVQPVGTAERARIAREMHDIVAHSLAGIVLQSGGARALAGIPS